MKAPSLPTTTATLLPALAMLLLLVAIASRANAAGVKPGDSITKDNAAQAQDLLSPGNLILVQRGMQIHVIREATSWTGRRRIRAPK